MLPPGPTCCRNSTHQLKKQAKFQICSPVASRCWGALDRNALDFVLTWCEVRAYLVLCIDCRERTLKIVQISSTSRCSIVSAKAVSTEKVSIVVLYRRSIVCVILNGTELFGIFS
jgi:hypothetical protein